MRCAPVHPDVEKRRNRLKTHAFELLQTWDQPRTQIPPCIQAQALHPQQEMPHQIPFPSSCVWVLQAAGRDRGGDTVCSPCPSATAEGRAAENSTQGWLCSALTRAWQPMPGSYGFQPLPAKLLHPQASFRDCHANKPTAASDCDN